MFLLSPVLFAVLKVVVVEYTVNVFLLSPVFLDVLKVVVVL